MKPTIADINFNRIYSLMASNQFADPANYAADKAFPVVYTDDLTGYYYQYNRGDWFRVEAAERAPRTESAGADFGLSVQTLFTCRRYALHSDLDIVTEGVANRNGIDLERDKTRFVTQNLMLHREQKWANKFFTTGIWGTDVTGVNSGASGNQVLRWNDANSNPEADIIAWQTYVQALRGFRPNTLVLGQRVLDALRLHPKFQDRIKYTDRGSVTLEMLAQWFGVDKVVVANTIINSAAEGAADSFDFMFGKHMLLVYANPTPNVEMPSGGYIFAYRDYMGGLGYTGFTRVFDLPVKTARRIEVETFYDMQVVDPTLGVFFSTVIA